jgi:hypothetical protein
MSSPDNQNSTDVKHEIVIKDNITTFKILETCVDEPPTENQKEKLLQFEEEFISRYTDDDEDYVAAVKLGLTTPPLIPSYRPFWNRRRDNKRKWEDRNDRHSHYPHNKKPNYGYNNDYRR